MFPDTEKGGRGQKGIVAIQFEGVPKQSLSHARTVLAYAPDLVDEVKT